MLRSMYAGISGMRGFQTKLDVIGNNIANVNTTGFKKGRVTFQDMMSQTTAGAQASTATRGGINPSQVGLGSQIGSIDNIHTQGFRHTTGHTLDFSIEGDGMFIVRDGTSEWYTRAGNFDLDDNGHIVNSDGLYLMGYSSIPSEGTYIKSDQVEVILNAEGSEEAAREVTLINEQGNRTAVEITSSSREGDIITIQLEDDRTIRVTLDPEGDGESGPLVEIREPGSEEFLVSNNAEDESITVFDVDIESGLTSLTIPDNAESYSIQSNGIVNYVDQNGDLQQVGQIALANFSNPAGLTKDGANLYRDSANAGYTGPRLPDSGGMGSIVSGALEMSNVDLAEEFTEMITAQRGFQANTRIITTSDEILQELVNLKR